MGNNSDTDEEPYDWTGGWRLQKRQMEEDARRKNAQLHQLMDDIQMFEERIRVLEAAGEALQMEAWEAREEARGLESDLTAMKETNAHMQESLLESQEAEVAVRGQLEEAQQQRQQLEQQYCQLGQQLEQRVDQLQTVLSQREAELRELQELRMTQRQQQRTFGAPSSAPSPATQVLQQELEGEQRQVLLMRAELAEAKEELDMSAAIIERLKRGRRDISSSSQQKQQQQLQEVRKQLQQERQNSSRLKLQLVSAEEDAQLHARELANVSEQLRAILTGEQSLADAVRELKACRRQLTQRDAQVAQLTEQANRLQILANDVAEENGHLRSQLKLEPRAELMPSKEGTSKWQSSKNIIAVLNRKVKRLEEEKLNLRMEVHALLREVSNMRGMVQITALEVPVKEALASLAGGVNGEMAQQLAEVKEAISALGSRSYKAVGRTTEEQPGTTVSPTSLQKAREIIEQLKGEIDEVTQKASSSRAREAALQRTLVLYRQQWHALQDGGSTKESKVEVEEPSVESGQVNISDTDQLTRKEDHSWCPSDNHVSMPQPAAHDARTAALLENNWQQATQSYQKILEDLENIRTKLHGSLPSSPTTIVTSHLCKLLEEVFEERQAASKALSQAKDVEFDAQVLLLQVQAKAQHLEDIREVYESEQTDLNVARWCQSFHKQCLANVELRGKVEALTEDNLSLKTCVLKKDEQVKEYIRYIQEQQAIVESARHVSGTGVTVDNSLDYATIAIQTDDVSGEEEDLSISRYMAENKDVLGQAITDLDKQRALNRNLQKALREKEFTLISKEKFINKMKSELKLHEDNKSLSNVATNNERESENAAHLVDQEFVDNLKIKLEESTKTIFKYHMFLEKTHRVQLEETKRHQEEVGSVIKERDFALKKVKELQLCLDSIPCRDTDGGQQQLLIDQVQSLSETISLLEKQFSVCRTEKSELESKLRKIEKEISDERKQSELARSRQEVACKLKSQNLEQENRRLLEEASKHKSEILSLNSQCLKLKKQACENPSVVLIALVEKMREKLIDQDKQIALLKNK